MDALDVLDWRRRVFALYAAVRAEHPANPLLPEQRAEFRGLTVAPYDPAWACPLAPAGNRVDVAVPVGELLLA